MSMDRLNADFDRIFSEPDHIPACPAQSAVERGSRKVAADHNAALDVPASKWTGATRTAAGIVLAHNFGSK